MPKNKVSYFLQVYDLIVSDRLGHPAVEWSKINLSGMTSLQSTAWVPIAGRVRVLNVDVAAGACAQCKSPSLFGRWRCLPILHAHMYVHTYKIWAVGKYRNCGYVRQVKDELEAIAVADYLLGDPTALGWVMSYYFGRKRAHTFCEAGKNDW